MRWPAAAKSLSRQARKVGRQPEIEENNPTVHVNKDIWRFDVTMQLTRLVESIHTLGKLRQRFAEPRLVKGTRGVGLVISSRVLGALAHPPKTAVIAR